MIEVHKGENADEIAAFRIAIVRKVELGGRAN
jgi:hypothetical protein